MRCLTTSPMLTIPASRPSTTTGTCRIRRSVMRTISSSSVVFGAAVGTGDVMIALTGSSSTPAPRACRCRTTSRSLTMPSTSSAPRATTSAPTLCSASASSSAPTGSSGEMVTTRSPLRRRTSLIRMSASGYSGPRLSASAEGGITTVTVRRRCENPQFHEFTIERRGAAAVDPRTTSSGRNTYSARGAGKPAISSSRARTAAAPIAWTACLTVVSGGAVKAMSSEASYPTTGTAPGAPEPPARTPRDLAAPGAHRAAGAERHQIGPADEGGGAASDEPLGGRAAALDAEERCLDPVLDVVPHLIAEPAAHRLAEPGHLAEHGGEALRADGEADAGVAELDQVPDRQLHRGHVVVADERRVHALDVAVDEHDRQPPAAQCLVAGGIGGGVGVQPGDEGGPGRSPLQQHLGVLVLVDAPGRLRAQHRRVPLPGQRRLDDLGEGR